MKQVFTILLLVVGIKVTAQETKPKLVVGIVVDQMRQDYLHRFADRFSEDGFKRIMNEGFRFENMHYNYIPTKTGPGHASIYSGTTPQMHGVIGNDWYLRHERVKVNCVDDEEATGVGSDTKYGKASSVKLKASTISDELVMSSIFKSQMISMSLKDRGAILPAGKAGKAFWFDKKAGKFITSTKYMNELPSWVKKFNKKNLADQYMVSKWETLFPIETYTASGPDKEPSERTFDGRKSGFPYDLSTLEWDYENIYKAPFGNQLLIEFAKQALTDSDLGKDEHTDMLAISFSATDYVGHDNGPFSIEIEDTYLRLDRQIADLLNTLDVQIGKGQYTIFITSDHGVSPIPQYLIDRNLGGGYFHGNAVMDSLRNQLNAHFGVNDLLQYEFNNQLFFDYDLVETHKLNLEDIKEFAKRFLLHQPGISDVFKSEEVLSFSVQGQDVKSLLARGYHTKNSGDLVYTMEAFWVKPWPTDATNHSSGYTYDTHVPLLWYGAGVKPGKTYKLHTITQIAPTISMMLGISLPNAAADEPLYELLEE